MRRTIDEYKRSTCSSFGRTTRPSDESRATVFYVEIKREEREQKKKIYLLWRIERFVSWIFVAIVACACVCVVCRLINNDDDDVQDGEDEFGLPKQVEQAGSVEA